jgi:hypothetical protein
LNVDATMNTAATKGTAGLRIGTPEETN